MNNNYIVEQKDGKWVVLHTIDGSLYETVGSYSDVTEARLAAKDLNETTKPLNYQFLD